MDTDKIITSLASPITKFIDTVSGAIGKIYEPIHIKRIANARTYEINKVSEAVRNNSDIPIVYNSSEVSINTSEYEELIKRTSKRLAYQEITKQKNIEAVTDNAYKEIQQVTNVSNEPVNPDWMFRFFNSIEDISDEYMQKIWGRVLAGEIKQPNSYSYRTLEKLKNMTQREAKIFQLISTFALKSSRKAFILTEPKLMSKYNIKFENILELEECGLMSSQFLTLTFSCDNRHIKLMNNSQILGLIKGKSEIAKQFDISIYVFTGSGQQLLAATNPEEDREYILDALSFISKNNPNFDITAHHIESIDDKGTISYNDTDILTHK